MKQIFFTLILACSAFILRAEAANDAWQGKLAVNGMELSIIMHLPDSIGAQYTMDSPDQGAFGIPMKRMYHSADSIYVQAPKIGLRFKGHIDNDTIRGILKQGFSKIPLTLVRQAAEQPDDRPQTPVPPLPYPTTDVTFAAPDSVSLAGTISMPEGTDTVTGVVFVSGSGQQDRDEQLFRHRPFAVIADYLARNGVASLRYDDRGVGASGGDPANTTVDSNAADARAAVEYLRRQPRIGRVGVIGHSEGGLIGYMLGSGDNSCADFVVSLAGPTIPGDSIILLQNCEALDRANVGDDVKESVIGLLRRLLPLYARNMKDSVTALLDREGSALPPDLASSLRMTFTDESRPMKWYRSFLLTNPAEYLSTMQSPVLFLVGTRDSQVHPDINIAEFQRFAPTDKSTARMLSGLNHLFQECETGLPTEYGRISQTISPAVLEIIIDWIKVLPANQ